MRQTRAPVVGRISVLALGAVGLLIAATGCGTSTTGPNAVTQLTVNVGSLELRALNATSQLTATPENQNGDPVTGVTLTYTSDDAAVATVDASGLVTAKSNGTATITVGIDGATITATVAVTVNQVPFQLGFQSVTGGAARTAFGPVVVEIQDSLGNVVSATNSVTLSLGTNPGRLVMHASGISDNDRIIELVDPIAKEVLTPPLQTNQGSDEMLGLAYSPADNVVYGTDRDDILWSLNPVTGNRTLVDTSGLYVKGVAVDPGPPERMLAGAYDDGLLYAIDLATADTTPLGRVTIAGDSITGYQGLHFDPTDGMLYGVAKLDGNVSGKARNLVTIDVAALTATSIGTLGQDGVAGITFLPDGTLLAVTGNGATNPEELWTVNKASGAMTFLMNLGNGADGEAIEAVPAGLTGTLTVAASAGIATFNNLLITAPGMGYTLVAKAVGLADGTSDAFNITTP